MTKGQKAENCVLGVAGWPEEKGRKKGKRKIENRCREVWQEHGETWCKVTEKARKEHFRKIFTDIIEQLILWLGGLYLGLL